LFARELAGLMRGMYVHCAWVCYCRWIAGSFIIVSSSSVQAARVSYLLGELEPRRSALLLAAMQLAPLGILTRTSPATASRGRQCMVVTSSNLLLNRLFAPSAVVSAHH
jgi:hypothetical protein